MSGALNPWIAPLSARSLIEASAGTGITTSLVTLYARLILENGLSPRQIALVTFTNAAADELAERIALRLHDLRVAYQEKTNEPKTPLQNYVQYRLRKGWAERDQRILNEALQSMELGAAYTIHGFCQQILSRYPSQCKLLREIRVIPNEQAFFFNAANAFLSQRCQESPSIASRFMIDEGIGVLTLLNAYRQVNGRARAHYLLPDKSPDLQATLHDRNGLLAQMRTQWKRDHAAISDILLNSPALNRNRYRKSTIEQLWLPALQSDALRDDALLPPWFGHLASSSLHAATNKKSDPPSHPFFELAEALTHAEKQLRASLQAWRAQLYLDCFAALERERVSRALVEHEFTYTGLIRHVYDCVIDPESDLKAELQAEYQAILVDEYQDTDSLQHALLSELFFRSDKPVFLIGDPKQAIYGFRGAEVQTYLQAKREIGDQIYFLDTNWRATPTLARALTHIYSANPDPFADPRIAFRPIESPAGASAEAAASLRILLIDRDSQKLPSDEALSQTWNLSALPQLIATDISAQLQNHSPQEFAVLCRTNLQVSAIADALRQRGLDVIRYDDQNIFESLALFYLEKTFFALSDPASLPHIRAALLTPAYAAIDVNSDWISVFQTLSGAWQAQGFAVFLGEWMRFTQGTTAIANAAHDDAWQHDLHALVEILLNYRGEELKNPATAYTWLRQLRLDPLSRGALDVPVFRPPPRRDRDAIVVTTVHKAKGLEYPRVYLPYACLPERDDTDERFVPFHDANQPDQFNVDLGSRDSERAQQHHIQEIKQEGLRLLYVALTRARKQLHVVCGAFRGVEESPLGHLLELNSQPDHETEQQLRARCAGAADVISISKLSGHEA